MINYLEKVVQGETSSDLRPAVYTFLDPYDAYQELPLTDEHSANNNLTNHSFIHLIEDRHYLNPLFSLYNSYFYALNPSFNSEIERPYFDQPISLFSEHDEGNEASANITSLRPSSHVDVINQQFSQSNYSRLIPQTIAPILNNIIDPELKKSSVSTIESSINIENQAAIKPMDADLFYAINAKPIEHKSDAYNIDDSMPWLQQHYLNHSENRLINNTLQQKQLLNNPEPINLIPDFPYHALVADSIANKMDMPFSSIYKPLLSNYQSLQLNGAKAIAPIKQDPIHTIDDTVFSNNLIASLQQQLIPESQYSNIANHKQQLNQPLTNHSKPISLIPDFPYHALVADSIANKTDMSFSSIYKPLLSNYQSLQLNDAKAIASIKQDPLHTIEDPVFSNNLIASLQQQLIPESQYSNIANHKQQLNQPLTNHSKPINLIPDFPYHALVADSIANKTDMSFSSIYKPLLSNYQSLQLNGAKAIAPIKQDPIHTIDDPVFSNNLIASLQQQVIPESQYSNIANHKQQLKQPLTNHSKPINLIPDFPYHALVAGGIANKTDTSFSSIYKPLLSNYQSLQQQAVTKSQYSNTADHKQQLNQVLTNHSKPINLIPDFPYHALVADGTANKADTSFSSVYKPLLSNYQLLQQQAVTKSQYSNTANRKQQLHQSLTNHSKPINLIPDFPYHALVAGGIANKADISFSSVYKPLLSKYQSLQQQVIPESQYSNTANHKQQLKQPLTNHSKPINLISDFPYRQLMANGAIDKPHPINTLEQLTTQLKTTATPTFSNNLISLQQNNNKSVMSAKIHSTSKNDRVPSNKLVSSWQQQAVKESQYANKSSYKNLANQPLANDPALINLIPANKIGMSVSTRSTKPRSIDTLAQLATQSKIIHAPTVPNKSISLLQQQKLMKSQYASNIGMLNNKPSTNRSKPINLLSAMRYNTDNIRLRLNDSDSRQKKLSNILTSIVKQKSLAKHTKQSKHTFDKSSSIAQTNQWLAKKYPSHFESQNKLKNINNANINKTIIKNQNEFIKKQEVEMARYKKPIILTQQNDEVAKITQHRILNSKRDHAIKVMSNDKRKDGHNNSNGNNKKTNLFNKLIAKQNHNNKHENQLTTHSNAHAPSSGHEVQISIGRIIVKPTINTNKTIARKTISSINLQKHLEKKR